MAMVAFGALAGTAAVMMNSDDAQPRRAFRSALVAGSQPQSGSNRTLTLVFGGAAALSAGGGLVLFFTQPAKTGGPKGGVGGWPARRAGFGEFRLPEIGGRPPGPRPAASTAVKPAPAA